MAKKKIEIKIPIKNITCFLTADQRVEKVLAFQGADGEYIPLLSTDDAHVGAMWHMAEKLILEGRSFRVIRFSCREDITNELRALYDVNYPFIVEPKPTQNHNGKEA